MAQSIDSVMTQNPVCLDADASLTDAAQAMDKQCIGDVLVLENGAVCGIVTDRDIAIRGVAHGGDPSTKRLGDICSRELVTLSPGAALISPRTAELLPDQIGRASCRERVYHPV